MCECRNEKFGICQLIDDLYSMAFKKQNKWEQEDETRLVHPYFFENFELQKWSRLVPKFWTSLN